MIQINNAPRTVIEDYTGPASYIPGGFVVTSVGPSTINTAKAVTTTDGYGSEIAAISGAELTIKVFTSGNTEVASGTDLSTVTVSVLEQGL